MTRNDDMTRVMVLISVQGAPWTESAIQAGGLMCYCIYLCMPHVLFLVYLVNLWARWCGRLYLHQQQDRKLNPHVEIPADFVVPLCICISSATDDTGEEKKNPV